MIPGRSRIRTLASVAGGSGRPDQVQSYEVPAPIGGLNTRDDITDLPANEASILTNWFPDFSKLKLRKGSRVHATSLGSGAVEAIFQHVSAAGVKSLIGCANNKIYDATTFNSDADDITGAATITSNKWQGVSWRHKLLLCNGIDQPLQWSGSGNVSTATYTGISDDNTLIQPWVYKSRLYFAAKDSASMWWNADTNSITGALTEEDFAGRLALGGYIQFIASCTMDLGGFSDEVLVVVSNMGEVLCYSGDYPGFDNWQIAKQFMIAAPIGRRAFVKVGGDLLILTTEGLIPLSVVAAGIEGESSYTAISDKIGPTLQDRAADYSANFGWCTFVYPRGSWLLINVPTAENARHEQYVMNIKTKRWTRFYGMHGACWCLHKDKPYFGGLDGKIYQADFGQSDSGAFITSDMKCAFNALGSPNRNKLVKQIKPHLETDASRLQFAFSLDVDYQNTAMPNSVQVVGIVASTWDTAVWDEASWADANRNVADCYGVSGLGKTISLRMQGDFKNCALALSSFDVFYELGGVL